MKQTSTNLSRRDVVTFIAVFNFLKNENKEGLGLS